MKSMIRSPIAMNTNQSNMEAAMKQATEYQQGVWTFDSSSLSDCSSSDSDDSPTTTLTASPLVGIPSHHASLAAAQLLQQRRSGGGMMDGLPHNQWNTNEAAIALLNQRLHSRGVEATNAMLAYQAQRRSQLELAALAAASSMPTSNSMTVSNLQAMKRRLTSSTVSSGLESGSPPPAKKLNGASLALAALNQQHHHQQQQHQQATAAMMAMAAQQRQQHQFQAVMSAASDHAASSGKPTILRGVNLSQFRQLNSSLQRTNSMVSYPRVESDGAFHSVASRSQQPMKKRFKRCESEYVIKGERSGVTQPDLADLANKKVEDPKPKPIKPEEHLRTLLMKKDLDLNAFSVKEDTFLPNTKEQTEDYPEAAQAARDEDLEALSKLHEDGKNLQSANVYGESIIHIVCRRGNFACYEFLTQKAEVSIRVRDDIGRTPLHDAAWTDKPNFELVETILRQEPDLLFARDNRKSSPLAYVPPNRWTLWCQFLDENPELIQLAIDSQKDKSNEITNN